MVERGKLEDIKGEIKPELNAFTSLTFPLLVTWGKCVGVGCHGAIEFLSNSLKGDRFSQVVELVGFGAEGYGAVMDTSYSLSTD